MIEEAIKEHFGIRCPDYAEGCPCCDVWKCYDDLLAASRINSKATRSPVESVEDSSEYLPMQVNTLTAQLAAAEEGQRAMLKQISELTTAVGVAEGKLYVSELAGIVEGWKERAEVAEAKGIAAGLEMAAKVAEDKAQQWDVSPGEVFHACIDVAEAIRDLKEPTK
jgi:hypothetical protein